jgi:acyl-CoA synthetase (AMP-forming)/AMP-acid ligase II
MTDVLAAKLKSIGVRKNTMVGIMMERCLEYIISYIAIQKAGMILFAYLINKTKSSKLYSKIVKCIKFM